MEDSQTELPIVGGKSKGTTRGPVYQGVCKEIRTLINEEVLDKNERAGTISQARSLAHSIDTASGHFSPLAREYGASLATMHKQLAELMAKLHGAMADPFAALLEDDEQ